MSMADELWELVIDFAAGDCGPDDALIELDGNVDSLPPDVLQRERQRRAVLWSLALTCRRFARIAGPSLLRRVLIDSRRGLAAFRRRIAGRKVLAGRVRSFIVCNIWLHRSAEHAEDDAWDYLEAELGDRWASTLPAWADLLALRDERCRTEMDVNLDHFAAILPCLVACQSLTVATYCAPGFDRREGREGDRIQPLSLPLSLRSFSAHCFLAADLFGHCLPVLARVAIAEEFTWNVEHQTELRLGEPAAGTAWQMLVALRSLRIRVMDLGMVGVGLEELLVNATALTSLDVGLWAHDALDDVEYIVAQLEDAHAELASASPARVGALQRLAVWPLLKPSPAILGALPRSVECLELRVAELDDCAFDDPDNDAWTALAEAIRGLAPASRLRRLVIDAPAAQHRPDLGDWLRARSGRDVEVAWTDSTRASA